ncbi:MAG: class I SAM-dependent methyltransferase [Spirochaetota bacterium]|nr:MAG: class I SAM-dependent methyltransferase [Spirochaetota bacterium]
MAIEIDPEWWKKIFDRLYLLTDARSVCDDGITRLEVDIICEMLSLQRGQKILDLCCGHGRHSFELYERGFMNCTLVDYSSFLIDCVHKEASRRNIEMEIIQADARTTGLSPETFDVVIIMGNSLGYMTEIDSDLDILLESFRVLNNGGQILVDVINGSSINDTFNPCAWHEIGDDIVVCREREIVDNRVNAREIVLSKKEGLLRDQTYSIRFYTPGSIKKLLEQAGFSVSTTCTDFSPYRKKADFGCMNDRMIIVGSKM